MADNNDPIEWYLARDGQQHGPVTDLELKKIIELGYLKPTDLVWRQGMAEWALAESVLDLSPPAPPPQPLPPPEPSPARQPAPEAAVYTSVQPGPQRPAPTRPHPESRGPAGREPVPMGAQRAAQPAPAGPITGQPGASYPARDARPGGPVRTGPQPAPMQERRAPTPQRIEQDRDEDESRFPWRTAAVLVIVAALGAGAVALYKSGRLADLPLLGAPSASNAVPVVAAPDTPARQASTAAATAPSSTETQVIDAGLQKSPLWQRLKKDFPEWYAGQLVEAAKLSGESKSAAEINQAMIRAVVDLRRQHHAEALAASPARLKSIAASFVDSLQQLSRESTAACYGFISQGEQSPAIVELKKPEQRASLDQQLNAIFDAVAEGRAAPQKRDQPRREDYDALSAELGKRGWTTADLQLFTDARALSRAAPEKVCQMVQDWFASQLAIPDEATQVRLLGEALKPVVAG
ncbi:MAG: DUF4339 domain-containing protein [Proteobacteria bacterium]|nr:DUF4339 domain-containing protein [Pseudomonadota bacterium]